jgi:hypothetical protein
MCRTIESGTSDQAPRERQRARRYGRNGRRGRGRPGRIRGRVYIIDIMGYPIQALRPFKHLSPRKYGLR